MWNYINSFFVFIVDYCVIYYLKYNIIFFDNIIGNVNIFNYKKYESEIMVFVV